MSQPDSQTRSAAKRPPSRPVRFKWWYAKFFVSVVVFGIPPTVRWQWEGDYLDWRCSPISFGRYPFRVTL